MESSFLLTIFHPKVPEDGGQRAAVKTCGQIYLGMVALVNQMNEVMSSAEGEVTEILASRNIQ